MTKHTTIAIVTLALLGSIWFAPRTWAEGTLSLEGLATQLHALADRVSALESKVPSETKPTYNGLCEIGGHGKPHLQTVTKYYETYDAYPNPRHLEISAVLWQPATSHIWIIYQDDYNHYPAVMAVEEWDGCTIVTALDWVEEED